MFCMLSDAFKGGGCLCQREWVWLFTTTLSVSPYKNAQKLNEIGLQLSKEYQIPWLMSDFKKKDGYAKSVALSKEHNLYRQNYCGCEFSRRQAEKEFGRAGRDI